MNMNLVNYGISTLLGGAVGYITNDIAVKMLFKKFLGRWGGVIEDNYEEFIDNMSDLVESDLVNSKTLTPEFNKEEFKKILRLWVEDVLIKYLPEKSGTVRFEEIPGIERSVSRLLAQVSDLEPALVKNVFHIIGGKQVDSLISQDHYEYIVNRGIKTVLSGKNNYADDIKEALSSFLEGKTLNILLSERAIFQISENIGRVLQGIDLEKHDGNIDTAMKEILEAVDIDAVIKNLENSLGEMHLTDFVNSPENLSRDLIQRIVEFTMSPEGKTRLTKVITAFLDDAQKISFKLSDIVSTDVEHSIVAFINEKLPSLLDKVILFVKECKSEIEEIINNTVDAQLDSNLIGKIIKFLKDFFLGPNLAGKANIVQQIIAKINQYGDKAGEKLSGEILDFIKNNTIGDIFSRLVKGKVLSPESIVELINRNLREWLEKNSNFIDSFLQKKISDGGSKIDLSILKHKVLPAVFDKIKKEYLYSGKFKNDLRGGISSNIKEISKKAVSEYFDIYGINITFDGEKIKRSLFSYWDKISTARIDGFIDEGVTKSFHIDLKPAWQKNKERELNQVYKLLQKEELYQRFAEGILDFLNENIDKLLTGNVSKAVKTELDKLKAPEVNDMVKDFMGKELKPITILGAVLGAMVGALSSFGFARFGFIENLPWIVQMGIYGIIFAFVGIGTNWLAIKMLFHPYKPLFNRLNFSPFAGVVTARKPDFARNIGNFVKERMLGDDSLETYFKSNLEPIKAEAGKRIADSEYKAIDDFFADDERINTINNYILIAVKNFLAEQPEKISGFIAGVIKETVENGKLEELLPRLKEAIIEKIKTSDIGGAVAGMIEKAIDGKTLSDYEKPLVRLLESEKINDALMNILDDLVQDITPEKIKKLINGQNEKFNDYVSNHSFESILGSRAIEDLTIAVSKKIEPLLRSAIHRIIDRLQKEDLNPDTELSKVFGGVISDLLKKNIGWILEMISQGISNSKSEIKEEILDKMNFALKLVAKNHACAVVDTLIDDELPKFLKRKTEKILSIVERILQYKLSELGFTGSTLNIEKIEGAISTILESKRVIQAASYLVSTIIKEYAKVPIGDLLKILNINRIQDLVAIIERPLLIPTVEDIKSRLSHSDVQKKIIKSIKYLALKIVKVVKIQDLLLDIDLARELRPLAAMLLKDDTISEVSNKIIESILYKITGDHSFYSESILRKDLERFLRDDLRSAWNELSTALHPSMRIFFRGINGCITVETKDEILCEYLISSSLAAISSHLRETLKVINIQVVVEREINNMHPRSIKELFYKFAGSYFRRITWYGWLGVFGGFISFGAVLLLKWLL